MPSVVPLRNPVAQNAVDFNNQTLTNSGSFFKYKTGINLDSGINHYAGVNDINSIITCNENSAAPNLATLNLTALSPGNGGNINPGAEIILNTGISIATNIKILNSSGSLITESGKNYTMPGPAGADGVAKLTLVDKASNHWLFSGNIGALVQYSFTNCCGDEESFYQINSDVSGAITSVNTTAYFFDGTDNTKPYNGIYYDDTDWLQVINGVYISSSSCSTYNFTTSYTFYTVLGDYTSAVVGYSISDLDENDPSTFSGFIKFFTSSVSDEYPCYTGEAAFPDGTYYTTNSIYSLEFYKGYVISYTSI